MASTLRDLSLDSLGSADDLYRFAKRLTAQQGFAAAVGGLLRVHAVIHGASERTSDV